MTLVYLIGSLRNPEIPVISQELRAAGIDVFDEWHAAGPAADDCWRDYEKARGWTYDRAVQESLAAQHIYEFDRKHLIRADSVLLVLPAGKSGHLELGWAIGAGKKGYILLDDAERWDVMYKFADIVTTNLGKIIDDILS